MNITPALPSPYQGPSPQDRTAVGAVRAPSRVRDAADEREPRQTQLFDQVERERLEARAEIRATRHTGHDSRVERALASYAAVAGEGERNSLRDMLGFDAYA